MHLARTDQLQPLPAAHPRSETLQGREPAFQHAEAHLPRLTHTNSLVAVGLAAASA